MSIPSTRGAARKINAVKYCTGLPCKNGHFADRYTQSGTCAACIAECNRPRTPVAKINANVGRRAHYDAVQELAEIKVRAYPGDIAGVAAAAHMLANMRNNLVTFDDVRLNKPPTDGAGGTALYRMRVHPADIETVQEMARRALAAHPFDVQAARARAFGTVQKFVAESICPAPEFRP